MSPTVDDFSQRLEAQLGEEAEALAELEALHRGRTTVLMTGSDKQLVDHDSKITGAKARLERARAWIAKLQAELAEARAREDDAPKQAAYELAKRKSATMERRLASEYFELGRQIAALLSDLRSCAA